MINIVVTKLWCLIFSLSQHCLSHFWCLSLPTPGSMSDPVELPGLAHFCEHMLFMGTQKYPCENEYNKYLSEHGGSSNAYTAADHTNYYFDVAPDAFAGALDR